MLTTKKGNQFLCTTKKCRGRRHYTLLPGADTLVTLLDGGIPALSSDNILARDGGGPNGSCISVSLTCDVILSCAEGRRLKNEKDRSNSTVNHSVHCKSGDV